jgi:hypothetical protein
MLFLLPVLSFIYIRIANQIASKLAHRQYQHLITGFLILNRIRKLIMARLLTINLDQNPVL